MLAEELKQSFHRTWWALVIRGLIAIALGVFILIKPLDSVAAFALLVAFWAIASGITEIVHGIEVHAFFGSWWLLMLGGLVSVGFGVAALYYYPALSLAFAVAWVCYWLITTGIIGIAAGLQQRRAGLPWGWVTVWGVVCIAAGIEAIMFPPGTLAVIMGVIAGFAIISGVTLIVGAFMIRSRLASLTHWKQQATT
jgi:uncharacterized membrane protein HdeD (DUF308 family)